MNTTTIKLYCASLILLGMLTVAGFSQSPRGELSGTRWNLSQIGEQKIGKNAAFIEFETSENRLSGNGGCNRMFGSFDADGKNIKFSGIGATKKFCAQSDVMKRETELVNALGKTTKFTRTGNTLKFFAENRLLLTFVTAENAAVQVPVNLENKKWMLEATKTTTTIDTDEPAFIVFDNAKKSAGGYSGCNSFGGNYRKNGANINFSKLISTMRACKDEVMQLQREFMDGLSKANNFAIKNDKLYLYRGKNLLLTFTATEK